MPRRILFDWLPRKKSLAWARLMFFWLVETLQPLKLCSEVQWDPPTDFNGQRRQVSRRTRSWFQKQHRSPAKREAKKIVSSAEKPIVLSAYSWSPAFMKWPKVPLSSSVSASGDFDLPSCLVELAQLVLPCQSAAEAASAPSSSSPHSCSAVEKDPVPFSSSAVAAATGDPDLPLLVNCEYCE